MVINTGLQKQTSLSQAFMYSTRKVSSCTPTAQLHGCWQHKRLLPLSLPPTLPLSLFLSLHLSPLLSHSLARSQCNSVSAAYAASEHSFILFFVPVFISRREEPPPADFIFSFSSWQRSPSLSLSLSLRSKGWTSLTLSLSQSVFPMHLPVAEGNRDLTLPSSSPPPSFPPPPPLPLSPLLHLSSSRFLTEG